MEIENLTDYRNSMAWKDDMVISESEYTNRDGEVITSRHRMTPGEKDKPYHMRYRAVCRDGFNVSIQTGWASRCSPRYSDDAYADWDAWERKRLTHYYSAELGYPSAPDDLIKPWAELDYGEHDLLEAGKFLEDESYIETVYNYVPSEIIGLMLACHGGIDPEDKGAKDVPLGVIEQVEFWEKHEEEAKRIKSVVGRRDLRGEEAVLEYVRKARRKIKEALNAAE